MTEQFTPPLHKIGRLRLVSTAAAIGILIVLAGVYGIARLRGNPGDAACRPAVDTATRIAPLVHGEVAALAVAQRPFRVPDLAFKDAQGHDKTLADWRGRTVLLNLWATWCVPCRREMPALDRLQAKLGGPDFEVVAVNIDTGRLDRPKAFLVDAGVKSLKQYADSSADSFEALRVAGKALGLPTSLLIGPDGCELAVMAGPAQWDSEEARRVVTAMVGK